MIFGRIFGTVLNWGPSNLKYDMYVVRVNSGFFNSVIEIFTYDVHTGWGRCSGEGSRVPKNKDNLILWRSAKRRFLGCVTCLWVQGQVT